MENRVSDTVLIGIDLSPVKMETVLEVITYHGQLREVINSFQGDNALLLYKTLMSKREAGESLSLLEGVTPMTYCEKLTNSINQYNFSSEELANQILDIMKSIIKEFKMVTIADFYEALGEPLSDSLLQNSHGWTSLDDAKITCKYERYYIVFPPVKSLANEIHAFHIRSTNGMEAYDDA